MVRRDFCLALSLALVAFLAFVYCRHRVDCNVLYDWEVPANCERGTYSTCNRTPACRLEIEDAESREIQESNHRLLRNGWSP